MVSVVLMLSLLGVAIVSFIIILNNTRATKQRLNSINGSVPRPTRVSASQPTKGKFLTFENFQKSKFASNERIKQLLTTISNELSAAGLGDDPFRVLLVWIIIVLILPLIESLMGISVIVLMVTIIVSSIGPVMFIQFKKGKRKEKFEKQLPHALDIICNALKAGYTFPYSMNTVAKELEDPIAEEFLMTYRETQFGIPLTEALQHMAKRTGSADIELLNVAVSVQTTVGGNMIEILETISTTLTAKHDLEEDIKVKTASGKITGIMLAVLPVVLLIAMNFLNPEYVEIFFKEQFGRYMLIFCAIWEVIGYMFIRKILTVQF